MKFAPDLNPHVAKALKLRSDLASPVAEMFGKEFVLQMNFVDGLDELEARRIYGLMDATEKFLIKHQKRHSNGNAD